MRAVVTTLLAFGLILAAGESSAAPGGPRVELSGRSFHIAICGEAAKPGFARCNAHAVTDRFGAILQTAASATTTPAGYGPGDLRSAYAVSGAGGAGVTVAIVDAYGYGHAEADLAVYRAAWGLPRCTTANGCFRKVNQSGVKGSYPGQNLAWAQETALDLDMVSALCPACKILLVEANSNSLADLGQAVNTAAVLGARVISNSYSGGESGSSTYAAFFDHPGIAVTASSGDNGYGAQFPASAPTVTAVGGTSLSRVGNARGWSETAWRGAGSGCSAVYAKPAWQTDRSCRRRMEVDVSAVADPDTGVAVYAPSTLKLSSWQIYGGTSVGAPLIAALYALNGGAVTYGSNPYVNLGALNDVTTGSNGGCGGTYDCTAGAGYDGPTGLGTPIGVTAF